MRGHKFLIVLADSDYTHEELRDTEHESVLENVYGSEEPYMTVITCAHEKFGDNVVDFAARKSWTNSVTGQVTHYDVEISLLRAIDGKLYCWADHLTKTDLINHFEQTD